MKTAPFQKPVKWQLEIVMLCGIAYDTVVCRERPFALYTGFVMPGVSKLSLPPLNRGKESIGQHVARIRKERGFTQVELAVKIGIVQTRVTDYETFRLRLTAEMAVRFAKALDVSLDELLHPNAAEASACKPSRKVLRHLQKIEELPPTQQTTLLRTIDTFLEVAALKAARRAR